jgi:uncharacterized protein
MTQRCIIAGPGASITRNVAIRLADKDMEHTDKHGRTPLFDAVHADDVHRLRDLIAAGANVNAKDAHGETPLHCAAREYRLGAASQLLASGADIDARDNQGNTQLYLAVFAARSRTDMIRLLLSAGANKNIRNNYGLSPAELALRTEHGRNLFG